MPFIAKCRGDEWNTFDTDWHGPFRSKDEAEKEMIARFPKHASVGWMVDVYKLVEIRKMKHKESTHV